MTSAVLNITFDCSDASAIARFWAAVTGWKMRQRYFQPGQEEFSVGPAPGGDIRCTSSVFLRAVRQFPK